jgi:hypothetical protein
MKKLSKRAILNRVAEVLFPRRKPEDALEVWEISTLSRVSREDAIMAIHYFIDDEFSINLTDDLPRRFYC